MDRSYAQDFPCLSAKISSYLSRNDALSEDLPMNRRGTSATAVSTTRVAPFRQFFFRGLGVCGHPSIAGVWLCHDF